MTTILCCISRPAVAGNRAVAGYRALLEYCAYLKVACYRLLPERLNITADNYDAAWDILNHRYNNPQMLFTKQIEMFLSQPVVQKQSSFELKRLYDTSNECIHAIENLGISTENWDPLLVHLLSKKLDAETYSDYKEARQSPREVPTLGEFMNFLEAKFIALEPISKEKEPPAAKPSSQYQKPSSNNKPHHYQVKHQKNYQAVATSSRKRRPHPCPLCNSEEHVLFSCPKFGNLPSEAIMDTLEKNEICPNCLYKHFGKGCISERKCKECNGKHNTFIHKAAMYSDQAHRPQYTSNENTSVASSANPPRQHSVNHVAKDDEEILLTTISIRVKSADGTNVVLRALLDQGSQISLISENAAQMLGLQRKRYSASVSGIGPSSKPSKGIVTLECESIYGDYMFETQALIISRVINNLPNSSFAKKSWPHLQHIKLADPEYNLSKPTDLLLDASVYSEIIMSGLIKGPPQAPIAQQTQLGWILSGNVKTYHCNVVITQLEELSKYWELEDITGSTATSDPTEEEQYCEDLYQSTVKRLENGRYEVAIPMKRDFQKDLGTSKPKAIAQFLQQERKMARDPALSSGYKLFMKEYQELGHMRMSAEGNEPASYLPHHGVIKPDSTTTALRVVFNASAKTSSGYSLNDLMECGPNLQQDLQGLIMKWRQYKYVVTADIGKFFRQILVREQDQPLQSIIWRESPQDMLKQYYLTTVTYGTKAAPFLAMRTLKQIAKDYANQPHYNLATAALQNSFYMDDLLGGHDSLEQAKELQYQLIEVLEGAGMNLRKWSSNEPTIIQGLSADKLSTPLEFKDAETRKALGLQWNPNSDAFTYQYKLEPTNDAPITKRQLLSEISKIFDPLGWLSPITIRGKILFQKTWRQEVTWDSELPPEFQNDWRKLREDLKSITEVNVPRYLGHVSQTLHLAGFCDSSEFAFSCAVYALAQNDKGAYTTTLVAAKTKVVPIKKSISLPRLELLGALLLSQLVKKVLGSLSSDNIMIHAWTDSMIVLGWLHGDITKWKQFVANRVQQIKDVIPARSWRHVRSEENAADCASRGITSEQLLNHPLWWEGPEWLKSFDPTAPLQQQYQEPTTEVKPRHNVNAALQKDDLIIMDLLQNNSSVTRVAKTIAWVLRFNPHQRKTVPRPLECVIKSTELQNAMNKIIKTVQGIDFEEEISNLRLKGRVNHSSKLSNLNPFLDEQGVLRVGGRLANANIQYSAKHPAILSPSSRLAELVINQAHITTSHGGAKLTLSYVREQYWILSGNQTVKKQIRRCVKCRRYQQETRQQIMADLPQPRVTPSRPFTNTGVDFTGHVEIKSNKGRGVRTSKGYVAVFVCLATKAVHLELVSDLSTAAFLAAFRRMCSRRGTPKHMFSDNGTNFVGASRTLKSEYKIILQAINSEPLMHYVNEMGITWHFNAPAWPSAGGLWEAAVKSFKYHMKRDAKSSNQL